MPKVRLTEEAAEELEQAAIWYEQECNGLGERFICSVESGLALLKDDVPPLVPVEGDAGKKGAKQILLHRFPFSIVVLPSRGEMLVIAIAHHSRKPFYWSDRMNT